MGIIFYDSEGRKNVKEFLSKSTVIAATMTGNDEYLLTNEKGESCLVSCIMQEWLVNKGFLRRV